MACKLFDVAAFGDWKLLRTKSSQTGADIETAQELIKSERSMLRKACLLDASNCFDAFKSWINRPGLYGDDLQRCTPPWDNVFVFLDVPEEKAEFGVHVMLTEISPDDAKEFASKTRMRHSRFDLGDIDIANTSSMACSRTYVRRKSSLQVGVEGCRRWAFLDIDGRLLASSLEPIDVDPAAIDGRFSAAFFAFQLAHCRNINILPSPPYRPEMPRGMRNRSPKVAYHHLVISDTLIKREGGTPSGEHPGVPKHVVRGNFAHYTEENKLFGKYTGMFWRPMHIRGDAKHGIVGKEYAIEESPNLAAPAAT